MTSTVMSIKAEVLWDVIPHNLAERYAHTKFHGVTSQQTVILIINFMAVI